MHEQWLINLDHTTAILVPTRSLANSLKEHIAVTHIAQGNTVWEAPNILLWQDYLHLLWQQNRGEIAQQHGTHSIISARQATLLWTQVIEASRRREQALTLLDVQQTVRAVQRSWRLLHDWQVEASSLADGHIADTDQFLRWLKDYQRILQKSGLMDEPQLQQSLIEMAPKAPFKTLIWYCYDLISAAQHRLGEQAQQQSCTQQFKFAQAPVGQTNTADRYHLYSTEQEELTATLKQARALFEQDENHRVSIVIPDLQHRYWNVQETARDVFYPGLSPLDVQLEPSVYRFSLGQPLQQWPAIESALRALKLLNNRTTVADLCFLLRNQFFAISRNYHNEWRLFERWLKQQRFRHLTVDRIPELYRQSLEFLQPKQQTPQALELLSALASLVGMRQELQEKLQQQKRQNGFSTLSFSEWVEHFERWLQAWGWHTGNFAATQNSVQYQLYQRWLRLLMEFTELSLVQQQLGLSRALEILQQMARDTIFQPQAVVAPILISGVFEAIGRCVDTCFVLGMNDSYPAPPLGDSFVPNRLLRDTGFVDASAESSYRQAKQVINSLLASAKNKIISYSLRQDRDREIINQVSPLFRQYEFISIADEPEADTSVAHENYQDSSGPVWPAAARVSGGIKIFEHQSVCAFRAFATHRLGFLRGDEAEFGLDSLDRGTIVHRLLDLTWAELQTQTQLLALDNKAMEQFIDAMVERVCQDPKLRLNDDKTRLLKHEKVRLQRLLKQWLELEKRRPIGFSVVEREERRTTTIGGIEFDYIVDRLDLTDDGRSLIIDYKTGAVDRNDWLGERIRKPQMPLYALAHDASKRQPVSGISFAQVQQSSEAKFVELCETGMVRAASHYSEKYQSQWHSQREYWPQVFKALAEEFLRGEAPVNPIDDNICAYCELGPVCRIAQLKDQTSPAQNSESHDQ